MKLEIIFALFGISYTNLITPEGTINLLNPQTAALECVHVNNNYKISFIDCHDSSVSTFEQVFTQDGFFQIKLTSNAHSNEDVCFEINVNAVIMGRCDGERSYQWPRYLSISCDFHENS